MNYAALPQNFHKESYDNGVNLILECYLGAQYYHNPDGELMQCGGALVSFSSLKSIGDLLGKLFSPQTRSSLTRIVRSSLRAGGGSIAGIVTMGSGGDTLVNAIFALQSSFQLSGSMKDIIDAFNGAKPLFKKLFTVDMSDRIPIRSKLTLDDGFQSFENSFMGYMNEYVIANGTDSLDKAYSLIVKVIDIITKTVSDWVACLFPDTAGLAGEITRTILDFVVLNGYTYVYNLVSILNDKMQRLITDTFGLKKFVRKAVQYFRDLINNMNPNQFAELAQTIGDALGGISDNRVWKGYIKVATSFSRVYYSTIAKTYNAAMKVPFIPDARKAIIYVIDTLVLPYISIGVDIFNQMFPVFLMFTMFIERYESIVGIKK